MKILPFRKRGQPKPDAVRYVRFTPARELAEYGFDGAKPRKQDGSPSGFLLSWSGIDAERDRRVHGGPCQYVVVGEYIEIATDVRWPALAINVDWMEERGYHRATFLQEGRVVYGPWKASA